MIAPERDLLVLGVVLVVLLLLGKVLLDLLDVLVAFRRWREDGSDLEREELWVGGLPFGLEVLEDFVILDGLVDRGGSEQRVEASVSARSVMLVEDGLSDRLLSEPLTGLEGGRVVWFVVVDVEAEDVPILDRVGDGIGVELILEEVIGGSKGGDISLDLPDSRVILKDRGTSEAKELGLREELLDGPVVLAELRPMAFIEDEDHSLVAEVLEPLP